MSHTLLGLKLQCVCSTVLEVEACAPLDVVCALLEVVVVEPWPSAKVTTLLGRSMVLVVLPLPVVVVVWPWPSAPQCGRSTVFVTTVSPPAGFVVVCA